MLVNKPVSRKTKYFLKCFLGLSLTLIGQHLARAEFLDPTGLNIDGTIGYIYSLNKSGSQQSEVNELRVNLSGSSTIWQPWFATMSAALGLGLIRSDNNSAGGVESDTSSNNMNLAFSVFPVSRFPFQLTYSFNRNETDSSLFANSGLTTITRISTSRRLGISQAYITRDRTHINIFYKTSDFESEFSNFKSSIGGIRVNKAFAKHRYNIDANFINNKQKDIISESSNLSVAATHGYLPSAELGITSLLSFSTSDSAVLSSAKTEASVSQISSNASWRPEHKPYSVTGGIRFSKTTSETSLSDTETSTVGTGVTFAYRFSRQIRTNFTLNVIARDDDGRQSLSASESLNLGFFSSPMTLVGFFYSWNIGGAISNSSNKIDGNANAVPPESDTDTNSQSASTSLAHTLTRAWAFDGTTNVSMGFSQSFSASKIFDDEPGATSGSTTTDEDLTKSLSQSLSSSISNRAWGGTTVSSLAVSDSRVLNDDGVIFQLASFSLARNQGFNRLSSAAGSLTFQASRTEDPTLVQDAKTEKSGGVSVSYQHSRFLGVFALRYNSTLEQGSLFTGGATQKGNLTWNNSFTYLIGLLSTRLNVRVVELPSGNRNFGLNFSATRSF